MIFNFNLKKSAIYLAIKWERFFLFRFAKGFKRLFLASFVLVFSAFLYGFLPGKFNTESLRPLLGFSILSFVFFIFFWIIEGFLNIKLKNPHPRKGFNGQVNPLEAVILEPEKYNLAEFLSFEVAKAVNKTIGTGIINSGQLFYFLLADNPKLNFVFYRALLDIKEIEKILKEEIKTSSPKNDLIFEQSFQEIILEAIKIAKSKNHLKIEIGDAISALARQDIIFKRILIQTKLKSEDIEHLCWWLENIEQKIRKQKRFWDYENLARRGTLAKTWTAGYTLTIDRYSRDITNFVKNSAEFFAHQEEVKIVERILSRREINNALIVGESGSGRKSIVYGLAQKSFLGKSLPEVNYKRVVELDLSSLLAQIQNPEEVEVVLNNIFNEAVSAGNIILVINDLHNYIGQEAKLGVVDIAGIITPFLRLPNFQIIAITTYDGLHRNIEKNSSVLSLFEKVEVSGVSPEETFMILEDLAPVLEQKQKIFISYPAIRDIISLTERYLPSLVFPEKALDVLDEVAVYVATLPKEKVVLPKHVAKIITQKTEIPVGEIAAKEKEVLLNLEDLIHQRIINQEEAVREVSTALRRARADITVRKGPMGAFLFLGPTGVGKTETSKALAEFYFGSEERMIRLDMSEFQEIKDIGRLLGSEKELGLLTDPVRETPFSLVLLDEFEKAHPNILNLFLQVFDEGHLTDGQGRKIDFKNTIIIATSNAAYQIILEALKDANEWRNVKQKILDYLFDEGKFRPELINRFDAVVIFKPLSKENLLDIAELLLQKLRKNLKEKGIELIITQPLKERIVNLGYSPVFGARELRRVIQDKVENALASAILSGKLIRGYAVEINPINFELNINPKIEQEN